jgi:decaprenylphospho-beta-D-ribofuranose 2-oxidase
MGRGVVTNGDHTDVSVDAAPLRVPALSVPPIWQMRVVNRLSVRAFNELWFRKAPRDLRQGVQSYDKFFYPLDIVRDWNRLYGRRGFLQYQMVLPFEAEGLLPRLVEQFTSSTCPVSLAVLKRFGPGGTGYLSFPIPGWTLTADIPIPRSPWDLEAMLRSMDESLVEAGGRVYLAKDSRLTAEVVASMYPQLEPFREVRDRIDPDRMFQSDLADRLKL